MNKTLAFILAVVMVVALALIFTGCDADNGTVTDDELEDPRFKRIYDTSLDVNNYIAIYRDRETGVEYLFVKQGYGSGLCPLYDENGNVLVGEAEGKEDVE